MNVLVLGGGGREHALAWKISQSPMLNRLYCAPGNPGTEAVATNVALAANDFEALGRWALAQRIDLIVVGPEAPLVAGIVDFFRDHPDLTHIGVVGPDRMAAQLEGSKDFSKQFMARHGIPTARYATFGRDQLAEGLAYLEHMKAPYVLKADGLAGGKGVLIVNELAEAQEELKAMLSGKFGAAGERVLLEEFMEGREFSVFALTDGLRYVLLPAAKDYKRIGEGDTGLNTGGMGAVSPVPFCHSALMQRVEEQVVQPTIAGLAAENLYYRGFLFFGLIEVNGQPKVIEYNVRLGDPETEVILPRLSSDLLPLLRDTALGHLKTQCLSFAEEHASTVMAVSGGYPEGYAKGKKIIGIEERGEALAFHAGTSRNAAGELQTAGGRVLAFTGVGPSLTDALASSYGALKNICFDGIYYRRDIGKDVQE